MEYEKLGRKNRERYLDKVILEKRGYLRRGLLGRGSFSDVYCVEDMAEGGLYVCKVSWKAGMLGKEAQAMAELSHPLFPQYAAFWEEDGLGILLREFVPGQSLAEMLERRRFSARQTICVGRMLAEGLRYLHGLPEPLLFRDIKPANIIIRQDGRAELIDLGCVCGLGGKAGSRAGSPGFAAPEQLEGDGRLTAACDVYGLGQTLKAMLGAGPHDSGRIRGLWRGGAGAAGGLWARSGKGRKRAEKRLAGRLWRGLEACTKEDAGGRMPDMESVLEALAALEAPSGRQGGS
nr:protein kinase [uncultured Acetatifactor sp.]